MAIGLGTLLLIAGGSAAGARGVVQGSKGIKKLFKSNKMNKYIQNKLEEMAKELTQLNEEAVTQMDELGELEMGVLSSFAKFSEVVEKISNKPDFDEIVLQEFEIPEFNAEQLDEVSTGAAALLAGATGGTSGVLAGFAAAGAVKSAFIAIGSASTGTALSSLSGVALTNATLAAIGGGSLAAGGGGIALGSTILGISTAGISILIGGSIFNKFGSKVEEKIGDLEKELKETEEEFKELRTYITTLKKIAKSYETTLNEVKKVYDNYLTTVDYIVSFNEKTDWNEFNMKEKTTVENLVLLVGLLYSMCQVNLVIESDKENEINSINSSEIFKNINTATQVLTDLEAR